MFYKTLHQTGNFIPVHVLDTIVLVSQLINTITLKLLQVSAVSKEYWGWLSNLSIVWVFTDCDT